MHNISPPEMSELMKFFTSYAAWNSTRRCEKALKMYNCRQQKKHANQNGYSL